jgi:hypothetical protein
MVLLSAEGVVGGPACTTSAPADTMKNPATRTFTVNRRDFKQNIDDFE